LTEFLDSLNGDEKVFGEILLAFQNKVLPIKTTKLLPLVIFRLAESNKARANSFVSFLLANIFESSTKENSYRIFTQSNFYLFSYVLRSKILTRKSIGKILDMMIAKLKKKL
jgi:hexokinase